jgi:hypothetical protein
MYLFRMSEVEIMGKMTLEEVRAVVHDLSEEDKIELLGGLIYSVRSKPDSDIERKNLEEIKRRLKMTEDDPSLWLDGDEVMAELEAELLAKV